MDITDWIQSSVLLVTIVTLIIQQTRSFLLSRRTETRTDTKLRILYILQRGDLNDDQIIKGFTQALPTIRVNEVEIRKALYEMLSEETIRLMPVTEGISITEGTPITEGTRIIEVKYRLRWRYPRDQGQSDNPEADQEL